MSVITPLGESEARAWLQDHYGYTLTALEGTTHGIENSNFFLEGHTQDGRNDRRVLTVFESVSDEDIPYFCALLSHLGRKGLPVPAPIPTREGLEINEILGKCCVVVPRLAGHHIDRPSMIQCRAIGAMLARIHLAAEDFPLARDNPFGNRWRSDMLTLARTALGAADLALIDHLLRAWEYMEADPALPRGVIHADLFHDNALFADDTITGVIDFYNACDDCLVYDIAIVINDWCNAPDQRLDADKYEAVIDGYQSVRPLVPAELAALPAWQVFAALRFWLSRLRRKLTAEAGPGKSPEAMRQLMLLRLQDCKVLKPD